MTHLRYVSFPLHCAIKLWLEERTPEQLKGEGSE